MWTNLSLGTLIIAGTVCVHTVGLVVLTRIMVAICKPLRLDRHPVGRTFAMTGIVLGLFLLHTLEVWIWAFAYLAIGALDQLEAALYFSTTSFSTLGYGDVVLPMDWRLLGSLEGVSGFLLIGWSTAYLVAASTRLGPFRTGEHF